MNLDIIIEKVNDDVVVPLSEGTGLQMRHDGIYLNNKLHLWERNIICSDYQPRAYR